MTTGLVEIIINSKNYGKLNGTKIFVTESLYHSLESQKTRNGESLSKLLETGRAVPGLKHLLFTILDSNEKAKIVFTEDPTSQDKANNTYFVNYNEFKKRSRIGFFPLYKEMGLNTARGFLSDSFPDDFTKESNLVKPQEINRISKQLPQIIDTLSGKEKNTVAIIEGTSKVLKKLKHQNKDLKTAVFELKEQSNIAYYQQSLDELADRLTKNIHETRGKNSWQNWIYAHSWLFGIQYLPPIERVRISFDNIPDFLFPTLDGFIDILEIKRPSFDVIVEDGSHAGSYAWSTETNKAIGQVVNYIQNMEQFQLQLKEKINEKYGKEYELTIHTIKPRAYILIGVSDGWSASMKKALRNLNYSLHGIEILTYTDLMKRGQSIISILNQKSSN